MGDHQHTCKGGVQLHQQPGLSEEVGDDGNMHALMHGDEPGVGGHGDGVRGEGAQEEGQGRTILKKINISHTTSTSGPKSRPAAPWRIVKKRGIIPDKLVQSRLEKFVQTYPNLKLRTGESSTNGDEAPVSSTNSNGGGGRKES